MGAGRRRRLIIDRVKQIPEADLREQIAGGPYRENLMTVKGRDQFDQSLSNVKYGPEHQIRFDKGTKKNKFFASSIRSSEPVRINNFRGHVFSRLGENAPGANFFDFTGNDENGGWHQDMPAGQVWTLNQFSTSLSPLPGGWHGLLKAEKLKFYLFSWQKINVYALFTKISHSFNSFLPRHDFVL